MRLASLSRVVDARPLFEHSATFRSRSTQGPIRELIPLIPTRVRRLHAKHFHKHQPQLSLSTPRRCSLIPAAAAPSYPPSLLYRHTPSHRSTSTHVARRRPRPWRLLSTARRTAALCPETCRLHPVSRYGPPPLPLHRLSVADSRHSAEMNSNTGLPSTCA